MRKGMFVVFEGIDGSGKGTQAKLFQKKLATEGFDAIYTFEHTREKVGALIEKVVNRKIKIPPLALQFLFVSDRLIHLNEVIEPALEQGKIVICDRYLWSTIAYGSLVADKNWLLKLHRYCPFPDLTFLLKVDPKESVKRMTRSRDKTTIFEKEKRLAKIWRGYQWLAKKYASSFVVVDGKMSSRKIAREIYKVAQRRLRLKK